jgi:hypothetical protein
MLSHTMLLLLFLLSARLIICSPDDHRCHCYVSLLRLLLLPPGDVVYLRLASPISQDARRLLIAQLEKDIRPAELANMKAQRALAGPGSNAGLTAMNRQLQQAKQALQKVCGRLC